MFALLVERLKLIILFLLIVTLIGLWHLSDWRATPSCALARRTRRTRRRSAHR